MIKSFGSYVGQGKVSSKSSDPPELDSVGDETEKRKEDRCSGKFDLKQHDSETALEQKEGDSLKEKSSGSVLTDEKLEGHTDCNQTATTSQACQYTHRSPESLMTATACNLI